MKRAKPGDIFEINTNKGKAYLHYIYNDPHNGDFIRVLPGLYNEKPSNIKELIYEKERSIINFPIKVAYSRKLVEYVDSVSLDGFSKPQLMRSDHRGPVKFLGWRIVNTDTLKAEFVEELSEEQKKLSPWGIPSYDLLVEHLENDWKLEDWIDENSKPF